MPAKIKKISPMVWKANLFALLMMLPAVVIFFTFYLLPGIQAFQISTYDWSGFNAETVKQIGLGNYKMLMKDEIFWRAFQNNLLIIIFGGIAVVALGLFFANFLTRKTTRFKRFFRSMIFFPYSISIVAIGIIWTFVLNPTFGLLNGVLEKFGVQAYGTAWLGSRGSAMAWIIFVTVWWWVGFFMILLIAGIQRIPEDYYEAARIDGVTEWQAFWKITIPLVKDILNIGIMYWIINGWMSFGVVYVMTQGGPSNMTHTLATYMVWMSVDYVSSAFKMGYGTAIAVCILIIVVLFVVLYRRLTRRWSEAVEY